LSALDFANIDLFIQSKFLKETTGFDFMLIRGSDWLPKISNPKAGTPFNRPIISARKQAIEVSSGATFNPV
jgi:hypothetical protein